MSKLGFVMLFLSAEALATTSPSWQSDFSYETNLHYAERIHLEVHGRTISVNGFDLSANDGPINQDLLVNALSVAKPASPATCSAGTFTHTVSHHGKSKTEQGCLSDPRFNSLYKSFVALRDRSGRK